MSTSILLVDDDALLRRSLAFNLERAGYQVGAAASAEEALALVQQAPPGLVLLDIGLPKLNGYETCRRIREQPWGRDMLLVAVTGWGAESYRQRSREAGFDTHVVKPVDTEELLKLLESGEVPPRVGRGVPALQSEKRNSVP